jgi:hypothetical protein
MQILYLTSLEIETADRLARDIDFKLARDEIEVSILWRLLESIQLPRKDDFMHKIRLRQLYYCIIFD